ncbi:hypothetical protein ACQEU3_38985 [Spirillospora sp. CA-253888]
MSVNRHRLLPSDPSRSGNVMEPLPHHASFSALQGYVIRMEAGRGLSDLGIDSQRLKPDEELGELYDAVLDDADASAIAGELVDALILTVSVADRGDVDLNTVLCARTGRTAVALARLQEYAAAAASGVLDLTRLCLLAGREAGETCRAVRGLHGAPADPRGRIVVLADECGDLITALAAIAHRLEIDLEGAFRAKEEVNDTRAISAGVPVECLCKGWRKGCPRPCADGF